MPDLRVGVANDLHTRAIARIEPARNPVPRVTVVAARTMTT